MESGLVPSLDSDEVLRGVCLLYVGLGCVFALVCLVFEAGVRTAKDRPRYKTESEYSAELFRALSMAMFACAWFSYPRDEIDAHFRSKFIARFLLMGMDVSVCGLCVAAYAWSRRREERRRDAKTAEIYDEGHVVI